MTIIGIVAIAKNMAIGRDGKLPWHYSADLKFFKETTSRNTVVMGYTTWLSIGKPLPNRLNIVLSKTHELEAEPNLLLLRSVDDVVQMSEFLNGDIYIIGGAHTYVAFADVIKKWIVTEIPETVNDADAFMPEDFLNGFSITQTRELTDGLTVRFYEKTSK